MAESEPNTSKGERTKERILQAALELFRELGYEATTMRMVADAAKVSLGNAYYYFASKDLLLQAFYHEVHT
ncbi:MAG: helix-turn-helix transcriptional regulator, partial [Planctomycetes bacterium]|nr:helix-turn-helix transcriptional regulator [Planctomycetota bacterium]